MDYYNYRTISTLLENAPLRHKIVTWLKMNLFLFACIFNFLIFTYKIINCDILTGLEFIINSIIFAIPIYIVLEISARIYDYLV